MNQGHFQSHGLSSVEEIWGSGTILRFLGKMRMVLPELGTPEDGCEIHAE